MLHRLLRYLFLRPEGVTIPATAAALKTSRYKAWRLLTYGQGCGLTQEVRRCHNRGLWTVTPSANLGPSGGAPTTQEERLAVLRMRFTGGRKVELKFLKERTNMSIRENDMNIPVRRNFNSTSPPGKHLTAVPRRSPVPTFPTDGVRERVLALERWWTAAVRNATRNPRHQSQFSTCRPWAGGAGQITRWNRFVLLDARLRGWGADPREFVTAVFAEYYPQQWGQRFLPNPQHVCGPVGKAVWERWRAARLAEGGSGFNPLAGLPSGEVAVQGAARVGIQSEVEALAWEIRRAYEECRTHGLPYGVTTAWSPVVAWVLAATEPGVKAALPVQAHVGTDDAWIAAVRAVQQGPMGRQRWLKEVRDRVAGTPQPILPRALPPERPGAELRLPRFRGPGGWMMEEELLREPLGDDEL